MAYPVIPETVTVHLGRPDAPAENVTVPFAEYIKNVASSEIYPTWPENAIRANVLAQISYTLNRIYTEYYRARGYDFDITSTTQFDHAFVADREIFENVGQIVDETFNNYIVRRGNIEPFFAQFCDGVRTRCNGLSQWGSVDLAQSGLDAFQILQYYYGNDIELVTNAPVGENIPSYPGVPLSRGTFGEDVLTIKRQLNRIGRNYPAIPQITDMNSGFDAETEDAVRAFQNIFNLTPDGVVGKATWYKIKEVYGGVKRLSELTSEGLTLSEAERRFPEDLRIGDSGPSIRVLQYYLAFLGYFFPELPPIAITGFFNEETRDAVYTFQRLYGLPVTGIVNRETWNRIQELYNSAVSDLPISYQTVLGAPYPGRFLERGDTGEAVTLIQQNLNRIAASDPAIPPVAVTGVYDEATENAVRALQRQSGFEENGIIGPVLWSDILTRFF